MDVIGRRYMFIIFGSLELFFTHSSTQTGTSGTLETVRKRLTSSINGVDY